MIRWYAEAELANGEQIRKTYPYNERGVYSLEEEKQYQIECEILEGRYGIVVWYSVGVEEV